MLNSNDYLQVPQVSLTYNVKNLSSRVIIKHSNDSLTLLRPFYETFLHHHEEMWMILLNRMNRVLGIMCVSKGGTNDTSADVKVIMQAALLANASGIILSHNHPSGNMNPSRPDKIVTENIKNACQFHDISFLDHIIICDEKYFSFADEGLL